MLRNIVLDLTPDVQPHEFAARVVVNVIVAYTMQFTIQLWFKAGFTLDGTTELLVQAF